MNLNFLLKLFFVFLLLRSCDYALPRVSSVTPTTSSTASPTFALSEPRWVVYERALSKALIPFSESICEWAVLGISGQKVYVWAMCRDKKSPAITSVPAVIFLSENKEIVKVVIPRDGVHYGEDIRSLFSEGVQEKIITGKNFNFDKEVAKENLARRLADPALPPLVDNPNTPLP